MNERRNKEMTKDEHDLLVDIEHLQNRIKELEADKETLTKERDYYKERYNEFNNAFVKGGNKR